MSPRLDEPLKMAPQTGAARRLTQIVFRPWDFQIVATAVRFELAERLAAGPRTSADLAAELGAHPETFELFLLTCGLLGLVERDGENGFALTELGASLGGGGGALQNMTMMNMGEGMWNRMGRLHETVLTGHPVRDAQGDDLYGYYEHNQRERAWHAAAMADFSVDAGRGLAEHYDFSPYAEIVDVGGSLGVLLSHVLGAAPQARGTVFDVPDIVERGRAAAVDAAPPADRIDFVEGNFFEDAPPPADLYLMKQVLCDWSDENAARILANVHRGAPSGSRLAVVDWTRPAGPEPDHIDMMSLCLQVVTGGRVRTEAEFAALIEGAGFRFESAVTVPSGLNPRPWTVLQAVRP
jgi:SAM-dependent methyltransferase